MMQRLQITNRREQWFTEACVLEELSKFKEMFVPLTHIAEIHTDLTPREQSLLSSLFRNNVGILRSSLKSLESCFPNAIESLLEYINSIRMEIIEFCKLLIMLLKDHLLPYSVSTRSHVLFLKLRGDAFRYMSECNRVISHSTMLENLDSSLQSYRKAWKLIEESMLIEDGNKITPSDPLALSVAMNMSVCLYECIQDVGGAVLIAKGAFERGLQDLLRHKGDEELKVEYAPSATLLSMIRSNLSLWTRDALDNDSVSYMPEIVKTAKEPGIVGKAMMMRKIASTGDILNKKN